MGNKIAAIVIDTNNRRSVVIRDVEKSLQNMTDDEIKKYVDANRDIVIVGESDWLNNNKDVN